ncbi:type III secretion system guanine nucleotide exchange factor SopE2 [Salmonella enterica subsp. enterica serovar Saintpaul]|nr:type III secretion system guanine nucleotide exchange factor SopE2 [Salmonella enterica subsp. enterica serovar Saintpaul]EDT8848440.1 type III secretion system guanine nucleotide exchange factor SopE2 [Salmonella enterica subsp. enterica]
MDIQITHQVTEFDKEELLTGLRSYNAQFVDFSKNGQLGVYCRNESGEMVGGLIADSKDPAYARQTCEAILSAVYSNNKDQCCKLLISKGVSITPFLKEIGEAAQNAGLPGEIKNGVFTPGGAGANPFVVPLIASASIKYPHMFINHNQQVSFKAYAEKIVMKEVTPLFNKGTMPTPQQFQLTIENIANKYLQNAS